MNKRELRTLRGQLWLLTGLLAGSAVLAGVVAGARPWIEQFLQEKYDELPARLQTLAGDAAAGRLDAEKFAALADAERLALYEHWMAQPDPPPEQTPAVLVAAAPDFYLARAERSLVCGNPQQRRCALQFLALARNRDAVPILERWQRWASRRGARELVAEAADVTRDLARLSAADARDTVSSGSSSTLSCQKDHNDE